VRSRAVLIILVSIALVGRSDVAAAAPGDLRLASANAAGVASNGGSLVPSVSADGSLVAFFSDATNLHPADTDPGSDVFVKNLRTGELILASSTPGGTKGDGDSRVPVISADGTRVAFLSDATPASTSRICGRGP
jgi:Tol biopolymer transport system component